MAVAGPVVLLLLIPLPIIWIPLLLFPFLLSEAVEQTAGDEGHRHEADNGRAHDGCQYGYTETVDIIGRRRFTVGLADPTGAIRAQYTLQLSDQFVFVRALKGNDCSDIGAVSLDDPLGAHSW